MIDDFVEKDIPCDGGNINSGNEKAYK